MKSQGLKINAYHNNNVVFTAWSADEPIPNCLGFSLRRYEVTDGTVGATPEVLPSWIPFKGQPPNAEWKPRTTDEWPVQRFTWDDFTAKEGKSYQYEVVPMVGVPGALKPLVEMAARTAIIELSTACGKYIDARFTRGILATQGLAHELPTDADGLPSAEVLLKAITTPGNNLRERLSGGMASFLLALLKRAKTEGGTVYHALYELADPELVAFLVENPRLFHLILSNTGAEDETNKAVRAELHKLGADVHDRMLEATSIGHNKSGVYVDAQGKPQEVLSGSTNWTSTGLCCQSNNALRVRSSELAEQYLTYWNLLLKDGSAQGEALRTACACRNKEVVLPDGTQIQAWFSPNTKDRVKSKGAATPPDLADVFQAMRGAKQAIYFLCFYPGFPSVLSEVNSIYHARKDLMLRGAVSSRQAIGSENIKLWRNGGPVMVAASALDGDGDEWHKELLKLPDAHAIIHDKIVVVDPLSDDCVVVLGSHNLGFKASYSNDENLLIIRKNRRLAEAYMVHCLDVYNHYRFRYARTKDGSKFSGLSTDATWQDRYFQGWAFEEMHRWTDGSKKPAEKVA